jgi:hypothetical protein
MLKALPSSRKARRSVVITDIIAVVWETAVNNLFGHYS